MNLEDLTNRIICADCLDILRQLPDKCVDLVLTDPPYGKGAADGEVARTGGTWAAKYGQKVKEWDASPGAEVFAELFRVSKNASFLWEFD